MLFSLSLLPSRKTLLIKLRGNDYKSAELERKYLGGSADVDVGAPRLPQEEGSDLDTRSQFNLCLQM